MRLIKDEWLRAKFHYNASREAHTAVVEGARDCDMQTALDAFDSFSVNQAQVIEAVVNESGFGLRGADWRKVTEIADALRAERQVLANEVITALVQNCACALDPQPKSGQAGNPHGGNNPSSTKQTVPGYPDPAPHSTPREIVRHYHNVARLGDDSLELAMEYQRKTQPTPIETEDVSYDPRRDPRHPRYGEW